MKTLLLTLMVLSYSFAGIEHAPQDFMVNGHNATFVDFLDVDSEILYDVENKFTTAQSTIRFIMPKKGYPIFDLKAPLILSFLNGKSVNVIDIDSPDKVTSYKLITTEIPAGEHVLIIKNKIEENVRYDWSRESVQSAFWMSDLSDRKYIEQYLPSNLEYDQYGLTMEVLVKGGEKLGEHEIFTNGFKTQKAPNQFKIQFPDYFTSSSFYFHLTKKNKFDQTHFRFNSISGKQIPVSIYSSNSFNVNQAKTSTQKVLDELEAKLGQWPHPSVVIYVAGSGGMEHSGATMTSLWALGHELTHSYYARGVMPMDGNSGWMDEAIASWRDDGYQSVKAPSFSSTQMSGHSQYKRTTDRKAYEEGANFMAYLNGKLASQGGLIAFLAKFHDEHTHTNVTTKMFKKELELYSGIDFTQDFNQYIFGVNHVETQQKGVKENPYHPKLSKQELLDLL